MPGKSEITRAVRDGLDNLEIGDPKGDTEWTKAVKTKLCTIGREFGFKVGAGGERMRWTKPTGTGANGSTTSLGLNTSASTTI